MRARCLLPVCVAFSLLLLLLPVYKASGQDYIEYNVRINSDGSASWLVIQVLDLNASIDTWEAFQNRLFNLVGSAANETKREMTIDTNSLQINTELSSGSKKVEYIFTWQNFSLIQNGQIIFGDVFCVNNFFSFLYGDASLQIVYPLIYTVNSVSPTPDAHDEPMRTLKWYRTQDFISDNPNITLTSAPSTNNVNNGEGQYLVIGGALALVTAGSLIGFYAFKRHKPSKLAMATTFAGALQVESDEEKLIAIIRSSGGKVRQSAIVERCGFSKAKTSQLLAALEQKGTIIRYKKGRDKIVTLTERVTGGKKS